MSKLLDPEEARNLRRVEFATRAWRDGHDREPLVELFKAGVPLHEHEEARELIIKLLREQEPRLAGEPGKAVESDHLLRRLDAVAHYYARKEEREKSPAKKKRLKMIDIENEAAAIIDPDMSGESFRRNILPKYKKPDT